MAAEDPLRLVPGARLRECGDAGAIDLVHSAPSRARARRGRRPAPPDRSGRQLRAELPAGIRLSSTLHVRDSAVARSECSMRFRRPSAARAAAAGAEPVEHPVDEAASPFRGCVPSEREVPAHIIDHVADPALRIGERGARGQAQVRRDAAKPTRSSSR
jgi:hypothetical protein